MLCLYYVGESMVCGCKSNGTECFLTCLESLHVRKACKWNPTVKPLASRHAEFQYTLFQLTLFPYTCVTELTVVLFTQHTTFGVTAENSS